MPARTIALNFNGYWRDANSGGIPEQAGIYLVYVCTHNAQQNTVTLNRLVYMGLADNGRQRIQTHEKRQRWKAYAGPGQELCFAFAPIAAPDRERAEAALIFHHKPPENSDYRTRFPYEDTAILASGRCQFIAASFTVRKTVSVS